MDPDEPGAFSLSIRSWHRYLSSTMLMRNASSPPLQTIAAGPPPPCCVGVAPDLLHALEERRHGLHMQKWKAPPLRTALASIPLGALMPGPPPSRDSATCRT